jgi:peptidyl-prolyl cis-trans isomerase A (cyclophilin A)
MRIDRSRRKHTLAFVAGHAAILEVLEPRLALSGSPLPTLANLESPNDTVVRLETNYGDIDIELYNSVAPITVSNFLNYVTSGSYGDSFFHRNAVSPSPFVLQGGGFRYTDAAGLSTIPTNAPIAREISGKSNVAETIAMARTQDVNSATDQFFINYVDNSSSLDPTQSNPGYTVFGKVVQGWDVVLTIQNLGSRDLTSDPAFAGPQAGAMGEVPVGSSYNSSVGVRAADLVQLIRAEVIKPATVAGFFNNQVFYPEGFRSPTTTETLDLYNPNNFTGSYQVVVHYELGQRDAVVASATIAPHASITLTLSDSTQSGLNTVRSGVPYAVEVDSAFPEAATGVQPVAASMNRVDFGAAAGEAFFNPAGETRTDALKTWDLPRIERNANSREFITYENLSDTDAIVATVFHTAGGDFIAQRTLGPYRRGGLEVFSLGLPDGVLWARVTSTQDIVVGMSDWDLPVAVGSGLVSDTPGFAVIGVDDGGDTAGGFGGAEIRTGFTSTVSFVNPGAAAASVTLRSWRTSGLASTKTLSIAAGGRLDLVLDSTDLTIPADEFFSLTYTSDNPVAVQYTSRTDQGHGSTGVSTDGVASTFSASVAPVAYFADGELDPSLPASSQTETVSIFNPFATDTSFSYTVRYFFSDGTIIDGASGSLGANGRVDVVSRNVTAVRNKAASNPAFRTYGIAVIATGTSTTVPSNVTAAAGIVSLTRWDASSGHAIASDPMFSGAGVLLTDAIFQ